jgi:hypothetical protein
VCSRWSNEGSFSAWLGVDNRMRSFVLRLAVAAPTRITVLACASACFTLDTSGCTGLLDAPTSTFFEIEPPTALCAPDPQQGARFGGQVALSGTRVAATAPFETAAGAPSLPSDAPADDVPHGEGAVYLFDAAHAEQAPIRIIAPNADPEDGQVPNTVFPDSPHLPALCVALSDQWLITGVAGEDSALSADDDEVRAEANNGAQNAGAAYVYALSQLEQGDQHPLQYIKAPNVDAGDLFGASLALAGPRLIISAPGDDSATSDDPNNNDAAESGAVYSYLLQNGRFGLQQYLKVPPPVQPAALFGLAVGLDIDAVDGALLVVGAPGQRSANSDADSTLLASSPIDGAVYVYRMVQQQWRFEARLTAPAPMSWAGFGISVRAVNDRIAVGAPVAAGCAGESHGRFASGAVYVFHRVHGAWSLEQCMEPNSPTVVGLFGFSLALFGDRLLVGAPWDANSQASNTGDQSRRDSGAVYLEERTDAAGWQPRAYIKAPTVATNDVFGTAVDLGPQRLVIGAFQSTRSEHGRDFPYAGVAYVFGVPDLHDRP